MEVSFSGKCALVTGAGKGIGRGTALALAKGGAITYCMSRTEEDLTSLVQEHANIRPLHHDVSLWDKTHEVVSQLGPIDLVVNNAAATRPLERFGEVTSETFDNIMNTNVKAAINIVQIVSKGMIARKSGGAIVNISSIVSERAHPNLAYCVSKAALDMATKAMAFELGPHQIRVNSVNPAVVRTRMGENIPDDIRQSLLSRVPQNKIVEVDDVVHAVLYLLSDKSDMVNGAILPVDGGYWTH